MGRGLSPKNFYKEAQTDGYRYAAHKEEDSKKGSLRLWVKYDS